MNATERQIQGTFINVAETIQLLATGGQRRPINVAFAAEVAFPPLHPGPLPPGEGERGGTLRELSTRPVSSQREERFSTDSGRQSGVAAESSSVKPSQTQSNPVKPIFF